MMSLMDEEKQDKAMLRLAMAIEKAYHNPGFLIWRGFLIGLASGIGGVIGVAFIIVLLGLMVSSLGGVPVIGEALRDLFNVINR